MKVVDIAQEIYMELGEPSSLSIPAIAFWIRSNVGALNNYIDKAFKINDSSLEIEEFHSDSSNRKGREGYFEENVHGSLLCH